MLLRLFWADGGVRVLPPPCDDVESGIDAVIGLIKEGRLLVQRSRRGLIDEFARYSRELDNQDQPTERIRNKNLYHRLDALRHAGLGLPVSTRKPIRVYHGVVGVARPYHPGQR